MTRMRQRIAQRLKEAQNVNAMLTTFNEVDMRSAHVIQCHVFDNHIASMYKMYGMCSLL